MAFGGEPILDYYDLNGVNCWHWLGWCAPHRPVHPHVPLLLPPHAAATRLRYSPATQQVLLAVSHAPRRSSRPLPPPPPGACQLHKRRACTQRVMAILCRVIAILCRGALCHASCHLAPLPKTYLWSLCIHPARPAGLQGGHLLVCLPGHDLGGAGHGAAPAALACHAALGRGWAGSISVVLAMQPPWPLPSFICDPS